MNSSTIESEKIIQYSNIDNQSNYNRKLTNKYYHNQGLNLDIDQSNQGNNFIQNNCSSHFSPHFNPHFNSHFNPHFNHHCSQTNSSSYSQNYSPSYSPSYSQTNSPIYTGNYSYFNSPQKSFQQNPIQEIHQDVNSLNYDVLGMNILCMDGLGVDGLGVDDLVIDDLGMNDGQSSNKKYVEPPPGFSFKDRISNQNIQNQTPDPYLNSRKNIIKQSDFEQNTKNISTKDSLENNKSRLVLNEISGLDDSNIMFDEVAEKISPIVSNQIILGTKNIKTEPKLNYEKFIKSDSASIDDIIDNSNNDISFINRKSGVKSSKSINNRWDRKETENFDKDFRENKTKFKSGSRINSDSKFDSSINFENKNLSLEKKTNIIMNSDLSINNELTTNNEPIKELITKETHKIEKNKGITKQVLLSGIKSWANNLNKLDIMIDTFIKNKTRWENPNTISYYVKYVITFLTRFARHDVLEYLRVNHPIFLNLSLYPKDFAPFHELVWINKNTLKKFANNNLPVNKDFQGIKLTFDVLIKMGFDKFIFYYKNYEDNDESEETDEHLNTENSTKPTKLTLSNEYENYLMALLHKNNKLSLDIKNKLYNYFVFEWDNLYLIKVLVKNIMLETNTDIKNNYYNDLAYLIIKYKERGIRSLVLSLGELVDCNINSKNSNLIYEIIFGICSERTNNPYKNLENIQQTQFINLFVTVTIKNFVLWIQEKTYEDYIEFIKINSTEIDNYLDQSIIKYFRNTMRILGYFYQLDINKSNIISSLNFLIRSKIEYIGTSLLFFIQCAELNITDLTTKEKNFIKDYLIEFYAKSGIKSKLYIKKTFDDLTNSNYSYEKIEELLN